jgi:hypothetical protein
MTRLAPALLALALGACAAPLGTAGQRPADRQDERRVAACRAEATRLVQYRDRGQLMRTDEAANRIYTGSQFGGTPYPTSRVETDRLGAQVERDRLLEECLRGSPSAGGR